MIRHILHKLGKRKRPPAAMLRLGEQARSIIVSDQFENEDTIDLLIQLRTALILCQQTGLGTQILMQYGRTPNHSPTSSRPNSPTRSSHAGASTQLFEHADPKKDTRTEFEKILILLDDLVLNDCHYKTANPKPSRPPYTMQSIVVDIAILLTRFRDDSSALYSLGTTMLPAFESFKEEVLAAKLLSFHLDVLFPKLIKCKDESGRDNRITLQNRQNTDGLYENDSQKSRQHQHKHSVTPMINIETPAEENDSVDPGHMGRSSHLTIDTRLSVTQPSSSQRPSPDSRSPTTPNSTNQQPIESYHALTLFTPLLFFMIQYLNPYLASYRAGIQEDLTFTILRQTYSIGNFHRALRFMIKQKPDMYLDLLDVIAHSIPEVKYRACQILFHYFCDSLGHVTIAESFPKLGLSEEVAVLEQNKRRQEYEAERQREQQQADPTFLESMIGNSTSFNVVGINRKYRNGAQHSSSHQHQSNTAESVDDDFTDITHIWYPHMFPNSSKNQGEDLENQLTSSTSSTSPATVYDDINSTRCKECFKIINGYGLRCYQCKSNVHFNCYNYLSANSSMDVMLYVKEGGIQKVVSPQFCPVVFGPRSSDEFRDVQHNHITDTSTFVLFGHHFQLINLYTLMLCAACHLPLWGVSHQGYRCTTCNRFIHSTCLERIEEEHRLGCQSSTIQICSSFQPLLESDTKITGKTLSESLQSYYGDLIPLSELDITERSYEEVGTILNVLLLQENILRCGIAAGCLLTDNETDDPLTISDENGVPPNQSCPMLKDAIRYCVAYMNSGGCRGSSFLSEFYSNRQHSLEECVLSKEDFLSHIAAMMKSLVASRSGAVAGTVIQTTSTTKRWSAGDSRGYLKVVPNPFMEHWDDDELDIEEHVPRDMMGRDTMLSWVMENLRIRSPKVGELLLQHMQNLGLFERRDAHPNLFYEKASSSPESSSSVQCVFPVPFAIDCSPNVESLINAIEACLDDIDITVNECGMILLVRRCWPDSFMSQYTTERLVHAILSWIFQEDEKLTTLHAEYTASKKKLPGVRQNRSPQASPFAFSAKMKGTDRHRLSTGLNAASGLGSGAGSAYVTTRNALRDRYIMKWLSVIHEMDNNLYGSILFETIERIVEGRREECFIPGWIEKQDFQRATLHRYEEFMGHILKLKTCGLTFSSFDMILQRWLDKTYYEFNAQGVLQEKEPADLRNLAKLFSSKASSIRSASTDPARLLDIISNLFLTKDPDEVKRGVRWLSLMMHAGTGVPSNFLAKIARLLVAARATIATIADFTKLIWFQAVNVLNVITAHTVVVDIIGYLNESVLDWLQSHIDTQELSADYIASIGRFIKYSAVLACFAYNCPLSNITELDIVPYFGDHVALLSAGKRSSLQVENIPMAVHQETPIIRCMLMYLQYDQLNATADVIKMFYALVHWGFGISNKSDFTTKSTPSLIPAIWELLSPCHDYLSDINLNLLMKLISSDVTYFQSYVSEIFGNNNWQVRYKGLDNVYGLFTKMDAAFQTKWLPMLSNLGPVFSYLVECLWDKELNALFPDWQVLQWESLLEALETKHSDKSDSQSVDILERYMRPTPNSSTAADNKAELEESKLADPENNRMLILTLALQMLGNHLNVDSIQISRIKYVLVEQMGFDKCRRYNNSGEWIVEFGNLLYKPEDSLQNGVLISCSRSLKNIMDSFAPLPAETVATMAPDVLDSNKLKLAENSSPGIHFIDVALKLFNSDIDLTKLSHIILQTWLETILIAVYKHNILDRAHENSIVSCVKQIIELLIKDISEENKLLILEILKCLLRRSDHLTAMVLSKQIMALGKLISKSGPKVTEPVFLKAKQFLKSAFLRFAVAGLFVLMFKNQVASDNNSRDVDLFFLLRTVIDPSDIVPDEDVREVSYLRDQPVRDVLDKLMHQQMERKAFSTVLQNMSRYVETVHSHPYSEAILHDYAVFLGDLIKHTADWRRSDWDINPVFNMSAILLKEHPYHFSILLPEIQAILKHGIHNCTLQAESVVKLMASYTAVSTMPGIKPGNVFSDIIIEEIKNGLNNRQRLHRDTLLTLLQLTLWDNKSKYQDWYKSNENAFLNRVSHRVPCFKDKLPLLLEPLVHFLRTPPVSQQFTKKDFKIYNTISSLVVGICQEEERYMSRVLSMQKLEETRHCLRFLSWFTLCVLKEGADSLLNNLLEFEDVVMDLLTQTLNSAQINFDSPDLNFSYSASGEALLLCFLMFKCQVLLSTWSNLCETKKNGQGTMLPSKIVFWLSVWPPLKRLLESIDSTTLFVTGSVGLSVWNMFLSLLQFLFVGRSHIILANAHEWSSLLDSLLDQVSAARNEISHETSGVDELIPVDEFKTQVQKVRRMFDTVPIQVPVPILIDQLQLELRDIMRLQAEGLMFHNSTRSLTMTITGNV
ncbi:hypothetical protein DFQ28_008166 [Apophysomyces sp. BC1034]|nr:hypothetical protein DFQ28_008166 [Apophysomyces sp. BC1034]